MRVNHIRAALGCSLIACLGTVGVAAADPIDNEATGAQRTYVAQQPFDLSPAVCGFTVHVAFPVDNEYIVQSSVAADGTTTERITGRLVESLANTATGKSVNVEVSGPATLTLRPDGTLQTLEGQGAGILFFGPHTQAAFGVPGIDLTNGHVVQQLDDLGHTTAFSVSGTQSDGCALIG